MLARLPFDSTNKYAAALIGRGGSRYLYVKGAPERLLPWLDGALAPDGSRLGRADGYDRGGFERRIRAMTRAGGRVLLLAQKEIPAGQPAPRRLSPDGGGWEGLTLVCALLLADRLRPEAPAAVEKLRRAGIHVVMMTGDNRDTASAIAGSCGILGGGTDLVLESRELSDMTDNRLRSFCRASPSSPARSRQTNPASCGWRRKRSWWWV